ncbi:hypothetical protein RUND412_003683 [Rhizina undulata]
MPNIRAVTTGWHFSIRGELDNWAKRLGHKNRARFYRWSTHEIFTFEANSEREKTSISIMKTLHRLGCKLESLNFGIACFWPQDKKFQSGSDLWDCASLLENLTSLTVCVSKPSDVADLESIEEMSKGGTPHQFLSFAPHLKNLSLQVESAEESVKELKLFAGSDFKSPVISLLDILGHSQVWENLRTFNLRFPCIIMEELVKFLGNHGSTLDCLHLESPMLVNGTWRELLDFLKECLDIMDLVITSPCDILLDGDPQFRRYNVDAQLRMQDYVLHGGAPFPPTKQELEETRRYRLLRWQEVKPEEEEDESGEEEDESGEE